MQQDLGLNDQHELAALLATRQQPSGLHLTSNISVGGSKYNLDNRNRHGHQSLPDHPISTKTFLPGIPA